MSWLVQTFYVFFFSIFNLHFLFQNIVNGVKYECIQAIIYNTMIEGLLHLISPSSVQSNYLAALKLCYRFKKTVKFSAFELIHLKKQHILMYVQCTSYFSNTFICLCQYLFTFLIYLSYITVCRK